VDWIIFMSCPDLVRILYWTGVTLTPAVRIKRRAESSGMVESEGF